MKKAKARRSGHATGMAGEFFVMEKLFRLGHAPALTLGNAKSIDILVRKKDGKKIAIDVKAFCNGGKWGIGSLSAAERKSLVYVFLRYRQFEELATVPDVYVMPGSAAHKQRSPWIKGDAVYINKKTLPALQKFRDAWHLI